MTVNELVHGSVHAYQYHRCRCPLCRRAKSLVGAARRDGRTPAGQEEMVELIRTPSSRPRIDEMPWREHGACVGVDPAVFYPTSSEDIADAKAYCDRCDVRSDCYLHALYYERHGVWGGSSERQRARARRRAGIRVIDELGVA